MDNTFKIKEIPSDLKSQLADYCRYVDSRLKTIAEFDVWFEQTNPGVHVPPEWYNHIMSML